MPTLLRIDVSPRGDHSMSRKLSAVFTKDWETAHAGGKVIVRDLATTSLPFVELPWITGVYSDPSTHNDEQKAAVKIGNDLIAELKEADEYLIATPMYNFAIPAKLKAYIDHVVRSGLTFKANSDGTYTGLLTGKKATIVIASAGEYTAGSPAEGYDAESSYLRFILGFIGVKEVSFIRAGSTWKIDKGMAKAEDVVSALASEVAAAAGQ